MLLPFPTTYQHEAEFSSCASIKTTYCNTLWKQVKKSSYRLLSQTSKSFSRMYNNAVIFQFGEEI